MISPVNGQNFNAERFVYKLLTLGIELSCDDMSIIVKDKRDNFNDRVQRQLNRYEHQVFEFLDVRKREEEVLAAVIKVAAKYPDGLRQRVKHEKPAWYARVIEIENDMNARHQDLYIFRQSIKTFEDMWETIFYRFQDEDKDYMLFEEGQTIEKCKNHH